MQSSHSNYSLLLLKKIVEMLKEELIIHLTLFVKWKTRSSKSFIFLALLSSNSRSLVSNLLTVSSNDGPFTIFSLFLDITELTD